MSTTAAEINQARLDVTRDVIAKHGEHIASFVQEAMLAQRVVVGMPPYEATLAGGAHSYEVEADPRIWPAGTDPLKVIMSQSLSPDDSDIGMIFENATQFPGEGVKRFRVHFKRGRAADIQPVHLS